MKRLFFLIAAGCLITHPALSDQTLTNANTGSGPNAGDGDPLRTAINKLNTNDNWLASKIFSTSNDVVNTSAGQIRTVSNEITARFSLPVQAAAPSTNRPWLSEQFDVGLPSALFLTGETFPVTGWPQNLYWKVYAQLYESGATLTPRELLLSQTGFAYVTLVLTNPVPASDPTGWTLIVRTRFNAADTNSIAKLLIGFQTNCPGNYRPDFGCCFSASKTFPLFSYFASGMEQKDTETAPGVPVAFAVKLLADGWELAAQGGRYVQNDCALDSDNWWTFYRTTNTAGRLATNWFPAVSMYSSLNWVVTSIDVYTNFNFGRAQSLLDCGIPYGLKCQCVAFDKDLAGRSWATWQTGTGDTTADVTVKGKYRRANGTWSDPFTICGPGSGANRYNNGSLGSFGSQLVAVYNVTTNAWTNYWPVYRSVTLAGSVSLGAETGFDITNRDAMSNTNILVYNNVEVAPDGSLLLPVHDAAFDAGVLRSVNGTNWAWSEIPGAGVEPSIVREGNQMVAYLRPYPGGGLVLRSTSDDNGTTWTSATATSLWSDSGDNRINAFSYPDGRTAVLTTQGRRAGRSELYCNIVTNGFLEEAWPLLSATNSWSVIYPVGLYEDRKILLVWAANDAGTAGNCYFNEIGLDRSSRLSLLNSANAAKGSLSREFPYRVKAVPPLSWNAKNSQVSLSVFTTNVGFSDQKLSFSCNHSLGRLPTHLECWFICTNNDAAVGANQNFAWPVTSVYNRQHGITVSTLVTPTAFQITSLDPWVGNETNYWMQGVYSNEPASPLSWTNWHLGIYFY